MSMITKTIRIDDTVLKNIDLAIVALNKKAGVEVYDFTSFVRLAFNKLLSSQEIQESIKEAIGPEKLERTEMMIASETSLSKSWLRPEEDKAWENL